MGKLEFIIEVKSIMEALFRSAQTEKLWTYRSQNEAAETNYG